MSVAEALLPRCHFPPPGSPVTCGVSGGADSLALLVLAVEAGCTVTAVHVDHGLREGSGVEAGLVADVAASLGAGFRPVTVHVEEGGDVEARCRAARLAALGPEAALGHTLDDRAETLLLNLMRGTGLNGLTALRPGPRHPILELRRGETVALCAGHNLEPFRDPSNADPRFRRNRVRGEVIPLLNDVALRDVAAVLARTAGVLADDADLLDTLAEGLDPTDARALAAAPTALATRAVRRLLQPAADSELHPPDRATVARVLAVAGGAAVACDVGRGWSVRRSAQRLELVGPGS